MHYLRRLVQDELNGDLENELAVWRQMLVSRRLLMHVHANRVAALAHLVRAGLKSTDPEVTRWASKYDELSELFGFLTGETDGRATKQRSDRDDGPGDPG